MSLIPSIELLLESIPIHRKPQIEESSDFPTARVARDQPSISSSSLPLSR